MRLITEKLIPLAAMLGGVLLLTLSVPRLAASLKHGRAGNYLQHYYERGDIDVDVLPRIELDLKTVVDISGAGRYRHDLGVVQILRANASRDGSDEEDALLRAAEKSLQGSLKRAPANPYAWFQLADVGRQLGRPAVEVLQLLSLSILTGRAEKRLLIDRLNLAMLYIDAADEDIMSLISQQLRLAWEEKRMDTLKLIVHYGREDLLSAALSFRASVSP